MKLRNWIIIIVVIAVLIFGPLAVYTYVKETIVSVTNNLPVNADSPVANNDIQAEQEPVIEEPVQEDIVQTSCIVSSDCLAGEKCINNVCGTVAELYKMDCDSTCNFDSIVVSTSGGDSYTRSRGGGGYTGAGAVEWKLLSGPDYCQGDGIIVPIELIKKDRGVILSKEVLTLHPGETTSVITHPTSASVSFTMTIHSVNEVCS
ncbi:hypothetical protein HOL21_02985 [Candidatus Woesearchaeota archaeon]|mgnify:CR=1 FL=1|jgi:hypothetical protein|nr:hypothetical protein [Candidatus Woesearchaeota archaeon]MBT5397152.1 hypothetical protein [Candidatus Woesearchaeota archaeon]MBT5924469.1 hypothetical protein [Candidatus Woesearchaeota archaeon]MBT6367302.1 hypothetical protein [Candidatus Woesearchaeota archaeon]MBT7762552.1 hypothetical protein [Candidatus Woesearchaeota archaeon]